MCSLWISIQMHWLSKYFSTPFLSQISNINVINHYSPNLASQWEDLCPKDFIFLVLKSLQSPESPFFFPSWVFLLFLLTGVLPKWLCWLILFVVWAGSLCGQEKEKGPPFLLNHNRSQVWSYSSGFIRKDAVFWCFLCLGMFGRIIKIWSLVLLEIFWPLLWILQFLWGIWLICDFCVNFVLLIDLFFYRWKDHALDEGISS